MTLLVPGFVSWAKTSCSNSWYQSQSYVKVSLQLNESVFAASYLFLCGMWRRNKWLKNSLFYESLITTTKANDIFNIATNFFLKNRLTFDTCGYICTDRALATHALQQIVFCCPCQIGDRPTSHHSYTLCDACYIAMPWKQGHYLTKCVVGCWSAAMSKRYQRASLFKVFLVKLDLNIMFLFTTWKRGGYPMVECLLMFSIYAKKSSSFWDS